MPLYIHQRSTVVLLPCCASLTAPKPSLLRARTLVLATYPSCKALKCYSRANLTNNTSDATPLLITASSFLTRSSPTLFLSKAIDLQYLIASSFIALFGVNHHSMLTFSTKALFINVLIRSLKTYLDGKTCSLFVTGNVPMGFI